MLNIFSSAYWPSVCPLWINVCSDLLFIFWVGCFLSLMLLSIISYLQILETNPLSVIFFVNIFSQTVDCLFILFIVPFTIQKLLSLSRSHLFIFAFISVRWIKWCCCDLCQSVLPMFSSRNFIVSSLTFRYLIHFELIFVYGVKEWPNLIFFKNIWLSSFPSTISQTLSLKRVSFQHSVVLPPLSTGAWAYFWVFYPVPLIYISVFVLIPYRFDDCSFAL